MDGEVAAVAFAEYGALGMCRPQLAALGDGLAVGADQPLRDVKAAAVALRQPEHDIHLVPLRGVAQLFSLRAVIAQRIVEIARDEAAHDRPGRRAEPDPPGIARIQVSGKAISLAPSAPASSMKRIVFSTEASRSRKAGAACTAATLYFGCATAMAVPFPRSEPSCLSDVDVAQSTKPNGSALAARAINIVWRRNQFRADFARTRPGATVPVAGLLCTTGAVP